MKDQESSFEELEMGDEELQDNYLKFKEGIASLQPLEGSYLSFLIAAYAKKK